MLRNSMLSAPNKWVCHDIFSRIAAYRLLQLFILIRAIINRGSRKAKPQFT